MYRLRVHVDRSPSLPSECGGGKRVKDYECTGERADQGAALERGDWATYCYSSHFRAVKVVFDELRVE
jgi:hypothetical protein